MERTDGAGPNGISGWPLISTWIIPPSLGSNGLHCIKFLHGGENFAELGVGFVQDVEDLLADVLDVDVLPVGNY